MANKKAAATKDEKDIELEVLREENARQAALIANLKTQAPSTASAEFTYEGKTYAFIPKAFNHDGRKIKASEVAENLEIQKFLVESNSGLIKLIDAVDETVTEDESDDDEDQK